MRKEEPSKVLIDPTRDLLKPTDRFRFSCHPGIECFNSCCYDLNIFLTPYDVVRLKNRLKMSSTEFLSKFTKMHIGYATGLPVVTLKMREDGRCPFVTEKGCSVYPDRPTSCRLYPLARIRIENQDYYYIVREEHCKGFEEEKVWTIEEWLEDQGAIEYNEMNDLFMEIIKAKNRLGRELTDREIEQIYLACFDIDRFREIVELPKDDVEAVKFGIDWVINHLLR